MTSQDAGTAARRLRWLTTATTGTIRLWRLNA
jgi:hypothetical protein